MPLRAAVGILQDCTTPHGSRDGSWITVAPKARAASTVSSTE